MGCRRAATAAAASSRRRSRRRGVAEDAHVQPDREEPGPPLYAKVTGRRSGPPRHHACTPCSRSARWLALVVLHDQPAGRRVYRTVWPSISTSCCVFDAAGSGGGSALPPPTAWQRRRRGVLSAAAACRAPAARAGPPTESGFHQAHFSGLLRVTAWPPNDCRRRASRRLANRHDPGWQSAPSRPSS